MATATAATSFNFTKEVTPPTLPSNSEPPPLFDGTTRLYIAYMCPYAQRAWITRNCKGLQEKLKLVPIDLQDKPAWYKDKVYPPNKVPALEHNDEVRGESLDLIKFIDENFDGPALMPDDPAKKQFAEELFSYSDSFIMLMFKAMPSAGDVGADVGAAFDKLEDALSKFSDGPFFLGQFSLVDIAYVTFVERFQIFFTELKNYDITKGRSKLALWIEAMPSAGDVGDDVGAAFDKLEDSFSKFTDGPYFLGQFSLELNKIDAYSYARQDPQVIYIDLHSTKKLLIRDCTKKLILRHVFKCSSS